MESKIVLSEKRLISFALVICMLLTNILVCSALNYTPEKQSDGSKAQAVAPEVNGAGDSAQVIYPETVDGESEEKEPFKPFIPSFTDDEPFIDMEDNRDYSKQYNYEGVVLSPKNGACTVSDGVYTCTDISTIHANLSPESAFPYGTISVDVMNNGSDSGIIFGLSSTQNYFWEGSGVSYYFAFVNFEGVLFLGRTVNGTWSTLAYTNIAGFSATKTYNLKVLYRVDKVVLFLDDVPMLYYRTEKPLAGTGWGIRMGVAGATISNIAISNKVTAE